MLLFVFWFFLFFFFTFTWMMKQAQQDIQYDVRPAKVQISLRQSRESLGVSSCWLWRFLLDCADAQADMGHSWVHKSFCRFCCRPRALLVLMIANLNDSFKKTCFYMTTSYTTKSDLSNLHKVNIFYCLFKCMLSNTASPLSTCILFHYYHF